MDRREWFDRPLREDLSHRPAEAGSRQAAALHERIEETIEDKRSEAAVSQAVDFSGRSRKTPGNLRGKFPVLAACASLQQSSRHRSGRRFAASSRPARIRRAGRLFATGERRADRKARRVSMRSVGGLMQQALIEPEGRRGISSKKERKHDRFRVNHGSE